MKDIVVYAALGKASITMKEDVFVYSIGKKDIVIPFSSVSEFSVKLPKGFFGSPRIEIKTAASGSSSIYFGGMSFSSTDGLVLVPSSACYDECEQMRKRFIDYRSGRNTVQVIASANVTTPAPEAANLLICPECGGKLSRYAAACPSCGCPMNAIQKILADKEAAREQERAEREAAREASMVRPKMTDDGHWLCPACGQQQKAGRRVCFKCGAPFADAVEQ